MCARVQRIDDRIPGEGRPSLSRVLGGFDGIAIVVGITIGSGIFATPGGIAAHFSSFGAIALFWLLGGVFTLVGALIYGEMGTRMPDSGGEYAYLEHVYGPYVGFMFGWSQLFIVRTSAGAGLALVAVDYIGAIPKTSLCDDPWLRQILINLIGNAIKFTNADSVRWALP